MPRKPRVPNPQVVRLGWHLWKVQSSNDPGHYYFVEFKNCDFWLCECIGFEKTCITRSTDCRHIRLVKALYPEVHACDVVQCEPRLLSDILQEMREWGGTGGRREENP